MAGQLGPGLYESFMTAALDRRLGAIDTNVTFRNRDLANAEASDRYSRHLASIVVRVIDALPEDQRAAMGLSIVHDLLALLEKRGDGIDRDLDLPLEPARILSSILRVLPDGSAEEINAPLTPLLDTTLLTNAPGEPAIGRELRAEIPSADSIDALVAFVRWSGIRPMIDNLRRHIESGRRLRLMTTTYTNSTELRALDELAAIGAEIRVSYDITATRLHAKSWLFQRESGFDTAYIGSSNLTQQAMVTGLEWNVRVSNARNPDVIKKMSAVFEAYWESGDFVPFDHDEFVRRTEQHRSNDVLLSPLEIDPRPFQERLLEELELSRTQGHHRNLLVAATGTGKTVMAAVDYARLRNRLPNARLLFVAHRVEILDQSRATFRQALREPTFGEMWVGGQRPQRFDHVFASVQSLKNMDLALLEPSRFDVVIVDEFHHAAAPSYQALLEHLQPLELLGLTATPERADGFDVLQYFDGRIAAELRVWDAIDQQYLAPFAYYGVYDGTDLTQVPWRRGKGYDPNALTRTLTGDHAWAHLVIDQLRDHVADVHAIRAIGFCVTIAHAQFMAAQFQAAGIPAAAVWGDSPPEERKTSLERLQRGDINVLFTVDLFNEGVDVPKVDTLLLLRPTESATLFLQQLGRGLRKADGKAVCTVLDFVGNHRREFRFDKKLRALLGGSRSDLERQVRTDFPFLPSGCHFELDAVARDVVLASIKNAIPSDWRNKWQELQRLGDVSLDRYLEETGLELEDVYANNHSWTELRRAAGLSTLGGGDSERFLLRAIGRLLHVDDMNRIDAYRSLVERDSAPSVAHLDERERRFARMLIGSMTTLEKTASLDEGIVQLWAHPQVRSELLDLLSVLPKRVGHIPSPLGIHNVPLNVHARYTRAEILAAFDVQPGRASVPPWQTGVYWERESESDLFAFTLDKSASSFSPTTRYSDYAISPDLIHWESQAITAELSDTGQRYIHQRERNTNIALFARLRTSDRAFWCLGTAKYVSHKGERPIGFTWHLDHRLPGDLYAQFAAAVA